MGCGVQGPERSFGEQFNAQGGGVYALEVRPEGIRIWMFGRDALPEDVKAKTSPDPKSWGTPLADFPNTECDVTSHFRDMSIVVNIALCGDWAGQQGVFGAGQKCAGSCEDFVRDGEGRFDEAYWELGGFWVFQGA